MAEIISAILTLLSGIGVFLIACNMMSSNLEAVGSERLRKLFSKVSGSRMLGVGIGTVGTAAIQSSGATTVMVIGFVNAGIMTLAQAATVIYGANIGTTITGQIVALGVFGSNTVSATVVFSAMAGVGAFLSTFSKKDTVKTLGGIIAGFGMLFVGLSMMSGSMERFAQLDSVKQFLAGIDNAILLVFVGAVLTAIIQSSSVMTSVAIVMVVTGLITLDQGIFLTMGSNIGSCVVAILAGMTSGKNAKRTALIHLVFNVSGVLVFLLVSFLLPAVTGGEITVGTLFEKAFPRAPQTQLAMFHTVFNLITVLLILPLTDRLVALVTKLLPDQGEQEAAGVHEPHLYYIDEKMLSAPAIAVAQFKNEVVNMADIAMRNFSLALTIICTLDFSEISLFRKNEEELNYLNKELVRFLVRLSDEKLSARDHAYVSRAFHSVSDLERVGDYAENIVEYAESLKTLHEAFSEKAIREIRILKEEIEALFQHVMRAYVEEDLGELNLADKIEDRVDDMTNEMAQNHIRRLNERVCTPAVGAQYLSLASNAERVADHFINIANTIRETE
ncbi:Na/Pi cotransporter family protein [Neglectibacter caecimuris]|uniref:Na/Pi cotransporter family protein n=1 Tax=Neglectibacter caecimuris TaxID=3093658 RepID=UPI002AC8ADB4|nr:Na/Pi cotransporter family protein [Neglectibacter sp. M00184]